MAEHLQQDVLEPGKSKVTYLRKSDKICPVCGKDVLHVRSEIDNNTEYECPQCFYAEFKPTK